MYEQDNKYTLCMNIKSRARTPFITHSHKIVCVFSVRVSFVHRGEEIVSESKAKQKYISCAVDCNGE